jgi:uncharacterized protein YndB with AHSA1/START domain
MYCKLSRKQLLNRPTINLPKRRQAMKEIRSSEEFLAPVIKSILVSLPVEATFRLFTEDTSRWWPLATHSVGGESVTACYLEGKVGGRFYEVQKDDTQSDWGKVLVWEPPHRLAFTLHPGRTPDYATDVEVTFVAEPGGTRVTLIHLGWERCGEGAEQSEKADRG